MFGVFAAAVLSAHVGNMPSRQIGGNMLEILEFRTRCVKLPCTGWVKLQLNSEFRVGQISVGRHILSPKWSRVDCLTFCLSAGRASIRT